MSKLYIWEQEVSKVNDTQVIFKDWTEKNFTPKELKVLLTKEKKDLTQQRDLMFNAVIPEMLKVFEDYNIRKGDIQALLNWVVGSYNETFNQAIGKAFWTYEQNKNSAYFPENIRVSDIKLFLNK